MSSFLQRNNLIRRRQYKATDSIGMGLISINFSLIFLLFSLLILEPTYGQDDVAVQEGKALFNLHCAACHKINRKSIGPPLAGVSNKYDIEWIYSWVRNSSAMIASGDPQAVAIFEEYNRSVMTNFPQLSDEDIDNILAYTDYVPEAPAGVTITTQEEGKPENTEVYQILLLALLFILLLMVVLLTLVYKRLRKVKAQSDPSFEESPRLDPIWKAFVKNQFIVFVTVILLLLGGTYVAYEYMMQIGVDKGYAPVQPIHFSHKIHAGDNEIDCKYCHSSARVSKHSGIPSLNICMNCHQNIYEYNGEPDLALGYDKEFYTAEIKKLYEAVGWDEENQRYTGQTNPVKWVRIHNLPDFVFFNHAQHVEVAGVDCVTCHGPVEEMEVLYQYAPLTMGWCIECHRETNVDVQNNEYYQKIHQELATKYGVEQLTVAQFGGLECAKCHY